MALKYLYPADCADFTTIGVCGALESVSSSVEEIKNGALQLTFDHPLDAWGKYSYIAPGMYIKTEIPVRTTPEIANGQYVTQVEIWTVSATATKAERYIYSKASGGSKKKLLKAGTEVVVTAKPADGDRWKIKSGKTTGWMDADALTREVEITETIPATPTGMETVAPPWEIREQVFVIDTVQKTDNKITVVAKSLFYQLLYNLTTYDTDTEYTLQAALDGVLGSCLDAHDYHAYTDIQGTKAGCHHADENPVEAIMDPEKGLAAEWSADVVRDNWDIYLLSKAGAYRGFRVEYGKNLLGIDYKIDISQVSTRIRPIGEKKNGTNLYLPDNDGCVDSQLRSSYPTDRIKVLKCTDCKVGTDGVTEAIALQRMRDQAQAQFEAGADMPTISLQVEFGNLGDTARYAQYKGLEKAFLHDEIVVYHPILGIDIRTTVVRTVWDDDHDVMQSIECGTMADLSPSVPAWQIQGGVSGRKLVSGSVGSQQLAGGAVDTRHLQADSVNTEALQAGSVTAEQIAAGAVTAGKLAAGAITAGTIAAGAVTAGSIAADAVQAQNIAAGAVTARNVETGAIDAKIAAIDFAKLRDAFAEQMITRDGVADRYLIEKLRVRNLQVVEQTVGSLIVKSSDGNYYRLDIDAAAGTVVPTSVTVTDGEIAAGVTSDGRRSIIETDLTVADLSASSVKAINALIDKITASRIEVDTMIAREAFIQALRTAKIVGNQTIQMYVEASTSKIFRQDTQPQNGFKDGDLWVRPETGETFQAVHAEGFEAFYYDPETGVLSYSDSDALTLTLGSDGTIQGVSVAEDGTLLDVVTWERVRESEVDAMLVSVSQYRDVMQVEADGVHVRAGVLDESGNVRIDSNAPNVHIRSDGFGIIVPTYQGAGGDDKYRWIATHNAGAFQDLKVYTAAGCVNLKARAPGEIFFERR